MGGVTFDLDKAVEWTEFQDWCKRIAQDSRIELEKIDMQSMDLFDNDEVGLVKFKVHAKIDGKPFFPSTVFLRGHIDAILVILAVKETAKTGKYAVMIRQP